MTQTIRELHSRKSVRVYSDQPIKEEAKQAILQAALQAPTAGNQCLYTILDITDPALKERLAVTCDNQPFIATAPLVLIFCADVHRWYECFCRQVAEVRRPDAGDLLLAQADALIAAQNAVVAAESLGIGSCYIGDITENYETHKELLGLPDHVVPAAMLVFGYPTEQQKQRQKPARPQVSDIVCKNGYTERPLEKQLTAQQGLEGTQLTGWIERFCKRKWNSEFSREMSRSCRAMIEDFTKEKKEP